MENADLTRVGMIGESMAGQARKRALLLTAVALTVASCGTANVLSTSTTTLAPSAEAPPGYSRHVDVDYGFVMDVPDDWIAINSDDATVEELLEAGGDAAGLDPELIDAAFAALDGGVALILLNAGDATTSLTVIQTPRVGAVTPGVYQAIVPAEIERFGAADVKTSVVSLPAGDAVKATFAVPTAGRNRNPIHHLHR